MHVSHRHLLKAGSDTVGGALQIFILAMVLNPEVLQKAQKSIDSLCPGRLPDFSDYDRLPYVHAAIRESLRWCPVVMLSMFTFSFSAGSRQLSAPRRSRTSADARR